MPSGIICLSVVHLCRRASLKLLRLLVRKNTFGAFLAAHRHAKPSTIFTFAKNLRSGLFSRQEKTVRMDRSFLGRGERTQTFDLSVPNRARYQLRHTPIGVLEKLYTSFNDLTRGVGRLCIVGQRCRQPQTALQVSSCLVPFRRSSRARQFCRLPILVWR